MQKELEFYNHLILSGTKINVDNTVTTVRFYNHLILSGTKMYYNIIKVKRCFTIT